MSHKNLQLIDSREIVRDPVLFFTEALKGTEFKTKKFTEESVHFFLNNRFILTTPWEVLYGPAHTLITYGKLEPTEENCRWLVAFLTDEMVVPVSLLHMIELLEAMIQAEGYMISSEIQRDGSSAAVIVAGNPKGFVIDLTSPNAVQCTLHGKRVDALPFSAAATWLHE